MLGAGRENAEPGKGRGVCKGEGPTPFLDVVTISLQLLDLLLQVGFKLLLLIDVGVGIVNLRKPGQIWLDA